MKTFNTESGAIVLSHVQWVEPVRETANGYAIEVHLKSEVCHLFFEGRSAANDTLANIISALEGET